MPEQRKHRIAIVVPVNKQPTREWMSSLHSVAKNHTVMIVKDTEEDLDLPNDWEIYDKEYQENKLGGRLYSEFTIFHGSDSCRNFGHWMAYMEGYDILIGLEQDCIVPPDFISNHLNALMGLGYGWENPLKSANVFPRGFPYYERMKHIAVNMGLTENVLDINGMDRIMNTTKIPKNIKTPTPEVAHGMIPFSGKNFSCWTYVIPALLFLPAYEQGSEKIAGLQDVWGGYVLQKFLQKRQELVSYGNPIVFVDKDLNNAEQDADLQKASIGWEQDYYNSVDVICNGIELDDLQDMFKKFANTCDLWKDTVFGPLESAFKVWKKMFQAENKRTE